MPPLMNVRKLMEAGLGTKITWLGLGEGTLEH